MAASGEVGPAVGWDQTIGFRLKRMHLVSPLGPRSMRRVVRDLGGVHAQVGSAAELQIGVRMRSLRKGSVERALWTDRTLVKTWLMRGTLHLVDVEDYPLWASASATRQHWTKPGWLRSAGLTLEELEAAIDAVADALDGRALTREQLAVEVDRRLRNPTVTTYLRSGWGSLTKIVASRGLLCFGPNAGRNVTFVRPDQWLGPLPSIDPADAIADVFRRYLRGHAPATREDFARWWGFAPSQASRVIDALAPELAVVEHDGRRGYVLRDDLWVLRRATPPPGLCLLPMFDPYTLAGLPFDPIVPRQRKPLVFRTGAWVSAVILRDGRVAGVWTAERRGQKTMLSVRPFPGYRIQRPELDDAVARLQPLLEPVDRVEVT